MNHVRRIIQTAAAAGLLSAVCGCTIQDVFQSTMGGVDSDRAALNKINGANQNSFPEPERRAKIHWPQLLPR